jgi:hypothetical protein
MTEAEILQEGNEVTRYIESEGWKRVKDKFTERIMDLQSIKNLEGVSPEDLIAELKARNTAIDILMDIITELEGRADQHKQNTIPIPAKDTLILRK